MDDIISNLSNEILIKMFNINDLPMGIFYKFKFFKYKNYDITVVDKRVLDENTTVNFNPGRLIRVDKYSTPEISVYMRENIEPLKYLLFSDYYQTYKMLDLNITNLSNYNPSFYDSVFIGNYVITRTTIPIFDKHICVYGINKSTNTYYTAYDFYTNTNIIIDMFKIFKNLSKNNKNICLFNSIEVGSLPDVLHFHITNIEIPDFPETIRITDHCSRIENGDHPFTNSYLFNTELMSEEQIKNIPLMLYKLRFYNGYKYCSQIFFIKEKYILISFRKVNTDNIRPDDTGTKYVNEYYRELFGTSSFDHVYFPIGIFTYKVKEMFDNDILLKDEIKGLFNNNDFIRKLKEPFVLHENFDFILHDNCIKLNRNCDDGEELCRIPEDCTLERKPLFNLPRCETHPCINDNGCVNLKKFNYVTKSIIVYDCTLLPILYKLDDIEILDQKLENGKMLISGSEYYYIKSDNVAVNEYLTNFNISTQFNDAYIKLYTIINIRDTGTNYYLFTPVKTTLKNFIKLEMINPRSNILNLIDCIIVVIIYKLINLYKSGYSLTNKYNIDNIFVTNNNLILREYTFNNIISIPISKEYIEECNYRLNHNGNDFYLPFDYEIKAYNEGELLKICKQFIQDLAWICGEYHISNILLDDFNRSILEERINSLNDIINKFYPLKNIYNCKGTNYKIIMFLKEEFGIVETDEVEIYKKIIEILNPTYDDIVPIDFSFVYNNTYERVIEEVNVVINTKEISGDENIIFTSGFGIDPSRPHMNDDLCYNLYNKEKYFFRFDNFDIVNTLYEDIVLPNEQDNIKKMYYEKSINQMINYSGNSKISHLYSFCKPKKNIKVINIEIQNLTTSYRRMHNHTDIEFKINNKKINGSELYNQFMKHAFFNLLKNKYRNEIAKTDSKINRLGMAMNDMGIQEVFNFCMSLKYPLYSGYTSYNYFDKNTEYIFWNHSRDLQKISIGSIKNYGVSIFYDYKSFLINNQKIKRMTIDKPKLAIHKMLKLIINNYANFPVYDIYNLPQLNRDVILYDTIKLMIKEYTILDEPIVLPQINGPGLVGVRDAFINPVERLIVVKYSNNDNVIQMGGSFKDKYLKYKIKYSQLKKLTKIL